MKRLTLVFSVITAILCSFCGNDPIPKPKGMLRLEYPEAVYKKFEGSCPFYFHKNDNADVHIKSDCSMNVDYPQMNASMFITYKKVNNDLGALLRDAQKLTYEHVAKADNIQEQPFVNEDDKVYGMFYLVTGNAASASQFYVTDSTRHFLTGSLYFNSKPNYDSVLPAVKYLEEDIRKMMETIRWK
ncbi:gliding motility lipoprotein GldD [Galbibacter sp. EGI 63066]|uniref:gliding motility lipoprotein GldD n=1 Tax=Galbibacter sp. EGI 63066 TaxID=2993559 RepID=UPI002249512D|nr:gliding motility lipoprotein GldD [Galbibacter sp. EGI 63066]MCX2681817.1 gliding motility lipoprotein GldD [Galbibacter sp. EGI 63066]